MAWQKARMVRSTRSYFDHLVGSAFWVEAKPPVEHRGYDPVTGNGGPSYSSFTTNIVGHCGFIKVNQAIVELLPEFCDSAPRILWRDFIKGAQL